MKVTRVLSVLLLTLTIFSCDHRNHREAYIRFPEQTWERFNILHMDLPVERNETPVKMLFFARYTQAFSNSSLDVHVIMTTPAGEERIREYSMKIKDPQGTFTGMFTGDSCEQAIFLFEELYLNQDGILHLEIENLIPRMETSGLLGVGIRIIE